MSLINDLKLWQSSRLKISSETGFWKGGNDTWFSTLSMKDQVIGKLSYIQILVLNATGKLPSKDFASWLEINLIGLSYPDSRIWCNQIAAYSACASNTPSSAVAAAILGADSRAYGGSQTSESGMNQLNEAFIRRQNGDSWDTICQSVPNRNGKPMFIGFARPVDKDDERIQPYETSRKSLNLVKGQYLTFAFELSQHLTEHYSLAVNSGGYANAMFLDHGFTGTEAARVKSYAISAGAIASYRDNIKRTTSFLPQHCDDIHYTGHAPRELP